MAQPVIGWHDNVAVAEQDSRSVEPHLALTSRWRRRAPPFSPTGTLAHCRVGSVQNVTVIRGDDHNASGLCGRIEQPWQWAEGHQVPADADLVASCQVVID